MRRQSGFTIVELMIAIVVFSVVLVLVSMSIIEIHRVYYRGLTNSKTQETTRAIIQDVSQAIQFNGGQILSDGSTIQCVGTRRYSYAINQIVSDSPRQHGLIADSPASCSTAPSLGNPQDLIHPFNPTHTTDSKELLGENMQLNKFRVVPEGDLYRVTVRVVYGANDLLEEVDPDGTPNNGDEYMVCRSRRAGSQFCAVSELSTIVQQRVK